MSFRKQPFNEHADIDEDIVLPYVNNSNYTHTDRSHHRGDNVLGDASLGDSFNSMPDFTPRNFLIPTLKNHGKSSSLIYPIQTNILEM